MKSAYVCHHCGDPIEQPRYWHAGGYWCEGCATHVETGKHPSQGGAMPPTANAASPEKD